MAHENMRSEAALKTFELLPKEIQDELKDALAKSETPGDLSAFLLVGACPKCGNELTEDGDDAAAEGEVGDCTIGVCPECDYRWCLECGQEITTWLCPHWEAWATHCKKNDIFQGEDACMEDGYMQAFQAWLDQYQASL